MKNQPRKRSALLKNILLLIVIIATAFSCWLVYLSALYVFPLPDGDAVFFIPTAVRYASGAGLDNPINQLVFETDVQNRGRFCFYPPLFPWIIGMLMRQATAQSAFLVIAGMRIIAISWLAVLLVQIVKRLKIHFNLTVAMTIVLMVFSYAGMLRPTTGRPEALATIFVLAGITISLYTKGWIEAILQGIVIGLLGATHPAGAVIAVALLGIFHAFRYRTLQALQSSAIAAILGVVISLAIISISPNGLIDTLMGVKLHAAKELGRGSSIQEIINYWLFWSDRFFLAPMLFLCLLLVFLFGFFQRQKIGSFGLFNAWLCGTVFLTWLFGLRAPTTSYNWALFQPLTLCVLLSFLFRDQGLRIVNKSLVLPIVCLMLAISVSAPLQTIERYRLISSTDMTFANAQDQVKATLTTTNLKSARSLCVIGEGDKKPDRLWVLFDVQDYYRIRGCEWDWQSSESAFVTNALPQEVRLLLVPEYGRLKFRPPRGAKLLLRQHSNLQPEGYQFSVWNLKSLG